MKNFKRYALAAAAVLALGAICFFLFRPAAKTAVTGENLLFNGDFSEVKDSLPVGWYRDAYAGLTGSDFEVVDTDEGKAAHIVNHMLKDAAGARICLLKMCICTRKMCMIPPENGVRCRFMAARAGASTP